MIAEPEKSFIKTETLRFHSFDGGGPSYTLTVEDPDVVSYESEREYSKPDHEELDGAGYDVIFTLTGKKPGKTTVTVSSYSPIADQDDAVYEVEVDERLYISVTEGN